MADTEGPIEPCEHEKELRKIEQQGKRLRTELIERRHVMLMYLRTKVVEGEWHGVEDAASDLRDIDAALKILGTLEL